MNILSVPKEDLTEDNPYLFQDTLAISKDEEGGYWSKVGPGYYNNLEYISKPPIKPMEYVQSDVNSNNEIVITWGSENLEKYGNKPSLISTLVNLGAIGCSATPLYTSWPMLFGGTITIQGLPNKSDIATVKLTFI